jgi:hypothetical protein
MTLDLMVAVVVAALRFAPERWTGMAVNAVVIVRPGTDIGIFRKNVCVSVRCAQVRAVIEE